ncbi:MAG: hypothetical protein NTV09_14770, partial [Bacteroidetes bacterium]|nr:hypothetical protein [Bacteroidota bacterium]
MKKNLPITFISTCILSLWLSALQSIAQVENKTLAISLGNNGQIDRVLDHYALYSGVMFRTENNMRTSYRNDLKLSLHIKLGNDSIADWSFKGSYGLRSGTFDNDDLLSNGKYSQIIISISAGRNWNLKLRKFILSAGIAIPLYSIGKFMEDFDENYGNYGWHVSYTNEGGWVSGINGLTSVKYRFTKHFFMFSEITAG